MDCVYVGFIVPVVFNCSWCDIQSLSSRQCQLFHSGATEHNVTVCREDLYKTSCLAGLLKCIAVLLQLSCLSPMEKGVDWYTTWMLSWIVSLA